ncbi:hypothetical protein QJS10_CPB21g01028 [Acorus calamus]|uniref:DUF2231 domain-containing protein n=1 Tax=Acorus calamus TaxID=4465 RepID=A0AAV9C6E3_ACOCL|nr:hypothetical protein QJS10_CPB21g01028 [Acorus calamus]
MTNPSTTTQSSFINSLHQVIYGELYDRVKLAYWTVAISAFCIIGLVSVVTGDATLMAVSRNPLFRIHVLLSFLSFFVGMGAITLVDLVPRSQRSVKMAKALIWASATFLVYAIGFALCIPLPTSFMGPVVVVITAALVAGRPRIG